MSQMRRWVVALIVVALIWLTAVMVKADLNDADLAAASLRPLGALSYLAAEVVVWWSLSFLLGVIVGWSTWLVAPARFGDSIVALLWIAFLLLLLVAAADITPARVDFWLEAGLLMFFVYWLGCGLGWALREFAMMHRHDALAERALTPPHLRRHRAAPGYGADAAAAPADVVAAPETGTPSEQEPAVGVSPADDPVPAVVAATEPGGAAPAAVSPGDPVATPERTGAAMAEGAARSAPAAPHDAAPSVAERTTPSLMPAHDVGADIRQAPLIPEPPRPAEGLSQSAMADGGGLASATSGSEPSPNSSLSDAGRAVSAPEPTPVPGPSSPAPLTPGSGIAAPAPGGDKHPGGQPQGLVAARDGKPDDLKLIRGIGKQNEERLNGLGIWHFDQIAAWTPENALWVGSYLAFPGRIQREQWVAQAAEFAAGRVPAIAKRAGPATTQGNVRRSGPGAPTS